MYFIPFIYSFIQQTFIISKEVLVMVLGSEDISVPETNIDLDILEIIF